MITVVVILLVDRRCRRTVSDTQEYFEDSETLVRRMAEEGREVLTQLHTVVLELIEEASRAKHRGNKDAQEARHEGKSKQH